MENTPNTDLDTYYSQTKAIASQSPKEKETGKKQDKSIYDAVKNFERDRDAELKKSLKITRFMLAVSIVVTLILAFAIASIAPLKTTEPFLMRVDNSTGYTDIITPFNQESGTYDETISRYFLTRFVENREGYEWFTIQTMFDAVELMASNSVFSEYQQMMYGDFSPLTKLKKKNKIQVRVKSVTFLDNETAQVRFVKAITEPDGKPATGYKPTSWIATIKFDYVNQKIKTEAQRQINPFGLNILAYKVDPEAVK